MAIILGLDISSSTIGYSVISNASGKIKIIALDHFKPLKKGSIFDRIDATQKKIQEILDQYKPDIIGIEDIAGGFSFGGSTSTTLIILATFNRACGIVCYKYLGNKDPMLCNVMSIRHALKTTKKAPKKEEMSDLIAKRLEMKEFPYRMKQSRKDGIVVMKESQDECDSLAVALYVDIKTRQVK
jgi:Holliday junction resolvasome RuvABC endonuclease subunit